VYGRGLKLQCMRVIVKICKGRPSCTGVD